MPGKILFILSNSDTLLNGKPTGWYLPELVHPLVVLRKAGYTVDFASPKGGVAKVDPGSIEAFAADAESQAFLKDEIALTNETHVLSKVDISSYVAVFVPGGHAPCFDLALDATSISTIEKFFASGRPVASVCHGPAAFSNVKAPDGTSIFAGRTVTCFSNEEEEMVGLTKAIPFLVESDIRAKGGNYVHEAAWAPHVVTDRNGGILITGSNPASATGTGEALVAALKA